MIVSAHKQGALPNPRFWAGKRVLLTGHTGFKGSWAALWLAEMGANVHGLSLAPETTPSLFDLAGIAQSVTHHVVDIRESAAVARVVTEARPEIILHLAAQPLVRRSYREPTLTFDTNVMGTAHLLDAAFANDGLKAILVITSDKVYANDEHGRAFQEGDALGGHDPYSASKAAVEMLVHSAQSRAAARDVALGTVRGGNVIGGGDYSEDRIVPDIVRAAERREPLTLRNPGATRPWQHVLDCLAGYFVLAEALASVPETPRALNIGPDPSAPITVAGLAEVISPALGLKEAWRLAPDADKQPREMGSLALDPTLARTRLEIRDRLPGRAALEWTAEWYAGVMAGQSARALCLEQIAGYVGQSRQA